MKWLWTAIIYAALTLSTLRMPASLRGEYAWSSGSTPKALDICNAPKHLSFATLFLVD
jgi:hypothetical protein